MYPLVHIDCTKRITGSSDQLLLYGSIFPDVAAMGIVSWEEMLNEAEDFSKYVVKKSPDFANFAIGLLVHERPLGIDRFVHGENQDGYAYLKGKEIVGEIKKFFPRDSLVVAHNFIEFACEMVLVNKKPELGDELEQMVGGIEKKKKKIADLLAEYFKRDSTRVAICLEEFNNFVRMFNFQTSAKAVELQTQITNRLRKTDYGKDEIKPLVEIAIGVVESDFFSFIDKVVAECRRDYLNYIKNFKEAKI
jgi:hypothetical protein